MITIEQLKATQDRLADLKRYLDIDNKLIQLEEEELRTQVPGFWDDQKAAEAQMKVVKGIRSWIDAYNEAKTNGKSDRGIRTEREKLLNKFRKLETDIATLENNMGFFAKSKNADKLIEEIKVKIAAGKEELKSLEQKIKMIDKEF